MLNILDCTPIAQFAIDLEHKITFWNKACEELTGYSGKQMIGTSDQWVPFYAQKRSVLADLIVDNNIKGIEKLYTHNGVSRFDVIPSAWEATSFFENMGGKDRHVYFLAAPILDPDGNIKGAIETVQDITRRVLSEKDLRESEERYRVLTKQVADGVALIQNEKLIFLNDAFLNIFGYISQEDLLEKQAIQLISDKDHSSFREMIQAIDEKRSNDKTTELRCVNAQGKEFWIESHNNIITWKGEPAVLCTVRDISKRKYREMIEKKETDKLRCENLRLRKKIRTHYGLGQLVGKCQVMQTVYDNILRTSTSNANVIVYGESGTGKELVARAIHDMSDRGEKPFIAVNCGAIPENLFESEFFGHKKGAFTGATIDKSGYLESAKGGTLFLDEVGEIPLNMQVKLLRAIDGGGYTPIGSTRTRNIDVRIIAATNRDLKDLVKKGQVREDFYYRIHIIPIQIPPLRDRKEDIPLLAYHFMQMLDKTEAESFLPDKALTAMQSYDWPGNVRELQNVIQRYATFNTLEFLNVAEVESPVLESMTPSNTPPIGEGFNLRRVLEDIEKNLLVEAMEKECGNRTRAAIALGTERRSLQRKLQRYQIA